eukprot:TRINITY_DN31594_c0_g1_i1.p1 TRINITY_DN31594_c0_g1~~TRINITY_DN31594_c0_g1_i1.p1  ORF type:complete len:560 (-),score=77.49 TRINITY_DN31594_c0_g1_i1:75-1721(-)
MMRIAYACFLLRFCCHLGVRFTFKGNQTQIERGKGERLSEYQRQDAAIFGGEQGAPGDADKSLGPSEAQGKRDKVGKEKGKPKKTWNLTVAGCMSWLGCISAAGVSDPSKPPKPTPTLAIADAPKAPERTGPQLPANASRRPGSWQRSASKLTSKLSLPGRSSRTLGLSPVSQQLIKNPETCVVHRIVVEREGREDLGFVSKRTTNACVGELFDPPDLSYPEHLRYAVWMDQNGDYGAGIAFYGYGMDDFAGLLATPDLAGVNDAIPVKQVGTELEGELWPEPLSGKFSKVYKEYGVLITKTPQCSYYWSFGFPYFVNHGADACQTWGWKFYWEDDSMTRAWLSNVPDTEERILHFKKTKTIDAELPKNRSKRMHFTLTLNYWWRCHLQVGLTGKLERECPSILKNMDCLDPVRVARLTFLGKRSHCAMWIRDSWPVQLGSRKVTQGLVKVFSYGVYPLRDDKGKAVQPYTDAFVSSLRARNGNMKEFKQQEKLTEAGERPVISEQWVSNHESQREWRDELWLRIKDELKEDKKRHLPPEVMQLFKRS